jgi:hypothetical protein
MIESVPSTAPISPPLTGASSIDPPSACARAASRRATQRLVRGYRRPDQYQALLDGLVALIDRAPDALVLEQLEAQIDHLEAVIDRNHWADAYNRALGFLESGRRADGMELLREVVAGSTDAELVDQASRALGALRGQAPR